MYVVIVGAGRIGTALAHWLLSEGHEIAVIERSASRCEAIEDELGSIAVPGDATEFGVLAKSGLNRADTLIAATGLDDVNLVTCQLAIHRFGVAGTVALVNNPDYVRLFQSLGVSVVINSMQLIIDSVKTSLQELVAEQLGEIG